MATSAEHRSKFVTLHRQWWRLHMSEKFSSGTINPKQKHNLNNLFSLSIKFDEIGNVLPKEKESLTYTMNFSFFYTMSRNNVNSNAYRFYTYFSTLCKYRMPWKSYLDIFYLFLLLSCTSKSLWQFLPTFLKNFYNFAVIIDPFQTSYLAPFILSTLINWSLKFMEITECLQNLCFAEQLSQIKQKFNKKIIKIGGPLPHD